MIVSAIAIAQCCPKIMTTYFKQYDYLIIMLLAVLFHSREAAVFAKYA